MRRDVQHGNDGIADDLRTDDGDVDADAERHGDAVPDATADADSVSHRGPRVPSHRRPSRQRNGPRSDARSHPVEHAFVHPAIAQRINATGVTVDVEREGNESLLRTALNGTGETDYTNGSTEYIRSEHANGSITYRTQQVLNADPYTGTVVIDDFIISAEHAPVATTTYDGVEVVELRASKADFNRSAIVPDTTVDAFTSRLLVDCAGRVRSFTYRISGTRGGKPFLFRLSDVGSTTVDRPAWASPAENGS